jgi:hypothetical protein
MQAEVNDGEAGVRGSLDSIGRRIRGNVLMARIRKGRRKSITHG